MDKLAEEIFTELLELDLHDRQKFLDVACAERHELRRQVESLLSDAEKADNYFTSSFGGAPFVEVARDSLMEKEGDSVGPYKLIQQIGEGGFGVVWLAQQDKPISRQVAVKVIKAGMDTKEVLSRFNAERQALARMDHPNIARVLDAGATVSGRPYFAMELVTGPPVTSFCDDRKLNTTERLRLFMDVCAAVSHAHQKGVIHRDIKPSNILIALDGDKPVVKVIDFGISKAIEGKLTDCTLFTRMEQWVGTPVYMSPEQAGLGSQDIDTRSDIYALGVLLYELLTGVPPFDQATLVKAGYEEMRRIIREVEPSRPSVRLTSLKAEEIGPIAAARRVSSEQLQRIIASDLDWIVMKAMEKSRDRRYETAAALSDDLGRFLADLPVTAKPPNLMYLFGKFAKRHRRGIQVLVGFGVLLIATSIFSTWQAVRATRAESVAEERLKEAIGERNAKNEALQDAEAVSRFMINIFRSPDPEADGRKVTVVAALDAATTKLDSDLLDQPIRNARLKTVIADSYDALGLPQKSLDLRRKALRLYEDNCDETSPEVLYSMDKLAIRLGEFGLYEEARDLAAEDYRLRSKHFGVHDPGTLLILETYALNTFRTGGYDAAIELQENLVKNLMKTLPKGDLRMEFAASKLIDFCHQSGKPEKGKMHYQELEKAGCFPSRNDAPKNYQTLLLDGLSEKRKVLEKCESEFGKSHVKTIEACTDFGYQLLLLDHKVEAIKTQEEVVDLARDVYGDSHRQFIFAQQRLYDYYNKAGQWDKAKAINKEIEEKLAASFGGSHMENLMSKGSKVLGLFFLNKAEEGLKLADEVLPVIRKTDGPASRSFIHVSTNRARCLTALGREQEAMDVLAECCPRMLDDTYINLMFAGLQLWFGKEAEYERTRMLMIQYVVPKRDGRSFAYHQLDRNILICCLAPLKNPSQAKEIAVTLANSEMTWKSPDSRRKIGCGPVWRQTIHGIANYRLGNFDKALGCLDEAVKLMAEEKVDPIDWERSIVAIYRPLVLHAMGKRKEATTMLADYFKTVNRLPDPANPLKGQCNPEGNSLPYWLAYREAKRLLDSDQP